MFWGSFYANSKGPTFFWPKGLGGIDAAKYIEHIGPLLEQFCQDHPDIVVMQDGAPSHWARRTISDFNERRIRLKRFPPQSPDLNPIEDVWNIMKDWIQRNHPQIIEDLEQLRLIVQSAWDAVGRERLGWLISTMPQRIQAVINARGGPTVW